MVMGKKYCPNCGKVVETKALSNYSLVDFKRIRGKRRKIAHLEENGGCGHSWYTVEVVKDALNEFQFANGSLLILATCERIICGRYQDQYSGITGSLK
jgi:hypothetical protein